jgi:hypothetical protein
MDAALELFSLHEFLARPDRDDHQREELIDGELIVSPGAKVSHAALVTVVTPDGTTEARMGETVEFHGVRVEVASN